MYAAKSQNMVDASGMCIEKLLDSAKWNDVILFNEINSKTHFELVQDIAQVPPHFQYIVSG